jgi:hypothetical protein
LGELYIDRLLHDGPEDVAVSDESSVFTVSQAQHKVDLALATTHTYRLADAR